VESKELQLLFRILNREAITPSADTIHQDITKSFESEYIKVRDILQVFLFNLLFLFKFIIINYLFILIRILLVIFHLLLTHGHLQIIFHFLELWHIGYQTIGN
jgi:hypothetical protein